ncbi:unnamed protein product [Blepharisma stoltei]|uniref:Uncharacterized protein n=1 Tax=Blepharisma stoltei TaxID=1481888 RepID=A0AAU9JUB1_9CILI|nr:unnamed protein product [Blepharisma stoltei]
MEVKKCLEQNCEFEAEYICQCTSPEAYLCKIHFINHCEISGRLHKFAPIFLIPIAETKEAILKFLAEKKSEHEKLKKKILNSFSQNLWNTENNFEDLLKKFESGSTELNDLFKKISQTNKLSKLEQDPILKLLSLSPDEAIEKVKTLVSVNSDSYSSEHALCELSQEIDKLIERSIKEKLEDIFESRFSKIEKILEKHDKKINSNKKMPDDKHTDIRSSYTDLLKEVKKNKKEFEDWKKATKLKRKKEMDAFNSQLLSLSEEINKRLSGLDEKQQISENSSLSSKINELKIKRSEILSNPIDPEIEWDFRKTCSLYENELRETCNSSQELNQAYKDYIITFHKRTSLYLTKEENNRTNLMIFDTKNEEEEVKPLDSSEVLNWDTCIAQIPNCELFCYGKAPSSGISLIIDENFRARTLPAGKPCAISSAIYYNRNVYCFGGLNPNGNISTLSKRFDLEGNRWVNLNPMPQGDCYCHCVTFKGNIFISGHANKNILRYSITSNSFTKIPFNFAAEKRKLLIKAERFYLIECGGKVYESEIGDENSWKQIGNSLISKNPAQVYYLYNKGAIYIVTSLKMERYFKFNLAQKVMVKI